MTPGAEAPEGWPEYSSVDLNVGEHRSSFHDFLSPDELEKLARELRKKEARRIPIGFQIPKSKKRKRKR